MGETIITSDKVRPMPALFGSWSPTVGVGVGLSVVTGDNVGDVVNCSTFSTLYLNVMI